MILGWVIQAILYLNVFILGVIITLAIQHFRAHRASKQAPPPPSFDMMPENVRDQLVSGARKQYQDAIVRTALELDRNMTETTNRLKQSLDKLRENVAHDEQQRYDESLTAIRNQAAGIVASTAREIQEHQLELRKHFDDHQAKLDAEMQQEAAQTEREVQRQHEAYKKRVAELEAQLLEQQAKLDSELQQESARTQLDLQKQHQAYQKREAELEAQLLEHQKSLESSLAKREEALAITESQLENKLMELQKSYVDKQQQMEAKLQADIEARRQALVGKLETELADTLLAFLADALGSDIDLGAQATSLTNLLEAHRDELLKGVGK